MTEDGVRHDGAFRTFAKIGLMSFGGPAAQIALMHRIIVDEKKWLAEPQFLHALNFCMLLPGPEAQQLATYVGWLLNGVRGGLAAGLLFILPGAAVMLGLSAFYVAFGDVPLAAGILFGLKAAVMAIVAQAVIRIGARALKSRAAMLLAATAFAALFVMNAPFPLVVLAAGLIGYVAGRRGSEAFSLGGHGDAGPVNDQPVYLVAGYFATVLTFALLWLLPFVLLALWMPGSIYIDLATFFSKMAVVTFGGAYAVLAYVAQAAVDTFHWIQPAEMIDGLGLAETTPGPLILVTQFVGFLAAYREYGSLAAGAFGALLTTWVTFAPCFLWIFAGAPFVERLRGNRALASALAAITAAVVGVVMNLALWFALHFLFARVTITKAGLIRTVLPDLSSMDPLAVLLTAALLLAAWRWKPGVAVLLLAGVGGGLALHMLR